MYGTKYSQTEAPTALAFYCPYMLLMAVNGILEAFVHAVAEGRALAQGHAALIVINVSQTLATIPLVLYSGTLGMIAADSLGMSLRIAYCCWFITGYHTDSPTAAAEKNEASHTSVGCPTGKKLDDNGEVRGRRSRARVPPHDKAGPGKHPQKDHSRPLPMALPCRATCTVLALSFLVSSTSCALFFGKGPMSAILRQRPLHFLLALGLHALVQAVMLVVTARAVWRSEKELWTQLRTLKRKQM